MRCPLPFSYLGMLFLYGVSTLVCVRQIEKHNKVLYKAFYSIIFNCYLEQAGTVSQHEHPQQAARGHLITHYKGSQATLKCFTRKI